MLSWLFSWRAVNSQLIAHGRKMSNNRQGITDRFRVVFLLLASFATIFYTAQEHSTTSSVRRRSDFVVLVPNEISKYLWISLSKLLLKEKELIYVSLLAKIVLIIHRRAFASNCFHHSFAAISFSRFPIVLVCIVLKYTENNFFKWFC